MSGQICTSSVHRCMFQFVFLYSDNRRVILFHVVFHISNASTATKNKKTTFTIHKNICSKQKIQQINPKSQAACMTSTSTSCVAQTAGKRDHAAGHPQTTHNNKKASLPLVTVVVASRSLATETLVSCPAAGGGASPRPYRQAASVNTVFTPHPACRVPRKTPFVSLGLL